MRHTLGFTGAIILMQTAAFAQPNDNCTNALTLGVPGVAAASTVNATDDGGSACGADTSPDVWYAVTIAPGETRLHVDLCVGTNYDSAISLHTACPGTLENQVTCNDDACGFQ